MPVSQAKPTRSRSSFRPKTKPDRSTDQRPPLADVAEALQSCFFISWSRIHAEIRKRFPDFDGESFAEELSNGVTWGDDAIAHTLIRRDVLALQIFAQDCRQRDQVGAILRSFVPKQALIDLST